MAENIGSLTDGIDTMIDATEEFSKLGGCATKVMGIGETIKPFIPIIATISGLIKEIIDIYEKAQFNKKICNSLLD
ncbi:2641_t:CDS:1, partial [Racocetra fulgida]